MSFTSIVRVGSALSADWRRPVRTAEIMSRGRVARVRTIEAQAAQRGAEVRSSRANLLLAAANVERGFPTESNEAGVEVAPGCRR